MTKVEFSVEVTEVLGKLSEVLIKSYEAERKVAVHDLPTEKLVADMETILTEIKSRISIPNTLSIHELPVGARVRDLSTKYYDAPIIWLVADHGFYSPNETTVLAERILAFKAFDAAEPGNPDSRRAEYGNNDYVVSNINQWLNSAEDDWFKPQHLHDQAPSEEHVFYNAYAEEPGFLSNFSEAFKRGIVDTQLIGGKAKVFLLSGAEVGLTDEGMVLALFKDEEFRKAKPTPECVRIDDEGNENEPDWWFLRTPFSGNSGNVRYVLTSGAINFHIAYNGHLGIRPALNFSAEADIRVSAEPDENGIYDII